MRTCAIHFYSVVFLWLLMTRDKKNGREHAVFTLSSSCSDSLPTLSWLSGVSRPVPSPSRTSRRDPYRARRKWTAVWRPYKFVSLRVCSLGARGGNTPREFARAYPERSIPKCRTKLSRGFPYPSPFAARREVPRFSLTTRDLTNPRPSFSA